MFWASSILFGLIQIVFLAWYFNAYMKVVKLRRDEIEYLKNVKSQLVRKQTIIRI